jgi:hypothetical protein
MKILNRPMFRYGGPIKEGIMTGIREPKKQGGSMGAALVGNPAYPRTDGREHHQTVEQNANAFKIYTDEDFKVRDKFRKMDEIILPNFLCLGAPKAGTTSLFEILKQHPEIGLSSFKETHFFDTDINWNKGKKWYSDSYFSTLKTIKRIGEFTPSYLSKEICAQRIKDTLGDKVKFVVILRNPIDRAFSHYLHTSRDEYEKLSFEEALQLEPIRLKKFLEEEDYLSYLRNSYFHQGLYAEMLERYLKYFLSNDKTIKLLQINIIFYFFYIIW